jgi:hypothetical protein
MGERGEDVEIGAVGPAHQACEEFFRPFVAFFRGCRRDAWGHLNSLPRPACTKGPPSVRA